MEFGHKVLLAESRRGLITDYRVLDGNPPDEKRVGEPLEHHRETFGIVPTLYAADRGFYSVPNIAALAAAGVTVECVPQRGGHKTAERAAYEKTRVFKRRRNSVPASGTDQRALSAVADEALRAPRSPPLRGLRRRRVLANNLLIIAAALRRKPSLLRAA